MTRRTVRRLVGTLATVLVIAAAVIFYAVFFLTPHMSEQEHIRNFEAVMPLAPADSVPLQEGHGFWPGDDAGDKEQSARGAVYYGYYCIFCHGREGDGQGPVGDSYMPKPADLGTERVHQMNDTQLLRAMLTGTGHAPVLERAVVREAYAPLLQFVRTLSGEAERRRAAPSPNRQSATE